MRSRPPRRARAHDTSLRPTEHPRQTARSGPETALPARAVPYIPASETAGLARYSGGVALAEVLPRVDVDLTGEPPQPARRRAAHPSRELAPLVVRRHDHEAALLLPLVDEVVDAVARPARPVLRPEVVEHDDVVAARVRGRLAVAEALAQRVEPGRH